MADGEYSFSLTTFSPTGKLVQIEYALNRVSSSSPALGIRAKNGVIIATEKKSPNELIEENSIYKIQQISEHIGIVYAGMPGDFRVLLKRARKEAVKYSLQYGNEILVKELVKEIASIVQEFTQTGGVRPFGLSLLICGVDAYGYHLYQIDPSGCYFNWKATCIGKDYQNNISFLEKRYNNDIEIEDAIHTAILTLKESYEGIMNEKNIEIGVACNNKPFKILTPNEIKDYLIEIE
ncbi:proteasome subunit alpha type-2, putative [Plasmodium malariae]|uniref:Proteasome subunit alpha type-2 n=1 Tax=Plasmodium malariae TaxID=5858 RepID=A0A1A8WWQ2_PLAMA|nr:proteasome subunit alpha type-2, putative [Plasmodium malariae]SBS95769.1 proteasome subunit alpha type-2, putative [Plasmodium malariae]SBT79824.1 proteasome subunit alpha type-2, putative [Plasmodium malariae]SCO93290.1 proteasome subunit alpha type-2, putative [Plasmodium malariae]